MKVPAWVYSQLDTFKTCPRKYYHLKVARDVVEPPSIHTEWGHKVHEALEYRVKEGRPLPEGMMQWEGIAKSVAALPGIITTELPMALDSNFQPADWSNAWTRGIVDVAVVSKSDGVVLDYKTGKRKLTDQLALYAAYMFAHHPAIKTVQTGFVWLKDKKIDKEVIHRDEVPAIWQRFLPTVNKLYSAYERDKWMPQPNGLCKAWCPCTGCEFNGRRDA